LFRSIVLLMMKLL